MTAFLIIWYGCAIIVAPFLISAVIVGGRKEKECY